MRGIDRHFYIGPRQTLWELELNSSDELTPKCLTYPDESAEWMENVDKTDLLPLSPLESLLLVILSYRYDSMRFKAGTAKSLLDINYNIIVWDVVEASWYYTPGSVSVAELLLGLKGLKEDKTFVSHISPSGQLTIFTQSTTSLIPFNLYVTLREQQYQTVVKPLVRLFLGNE